MKDMSMKKLLLISTVVLALVGCASGVKLDDVQVDDRSGGASQVSSVNSGMAARGFQCLTQPSAMHAQIGATFDGTGKPRGAVAQPRPIPPHCGIECVAAPRIDFVIEPLERQGEPDAESSDVQWIPMDHVLSLDLAFDHTETVRSYFDYRRRLVTTPILI